MMKSSPMLLRLVLMVALCSAVDGHNHLRGGDEMRKLGGWWFRMQMKPPPSTRMKLMSNMDPNPTPQDEPRRKRDTSSGRSRNDVGLDSTPPAGRNLLRHRDHQENDRRRLQSISATSEADPNVVATANCIESKGCHPHNPDKRAICHRQGKANNTLCLPAEAIAAHLAEHEDDTCGCCDVDEEKRRPFFCEDTVPTFECFESKAELKMAIEEYISSGSSPNTTTAQRYGWPIGTWCVSNVTDFSSLFEDQQTFNEDISEWQTSQVLTLNSMFKRAYSFDQDLSSWDVSNVQDMKGMFADAYVFDQDLSSWEVSNVQDMSFMFNSARAFDQDLSSWEVSNVQDMRGMFFLAQAFDQDLSSWDVSNVKDMRYMFFAAQAFNQDLSSWDVSGVTNMRSMFNSARAFNQDLSSWDVSSVTDMDHMFLNAQAFNQDLSSWEVSNVQDMSHMFYNAQAFNRSLCAWGDKLADSVDVAGMFRYANSCPDPADPVLTATPPGPFCHACT